MICLLYTSHPRKNSAGEAREYIVNPYQMAAVNGRYYLIGNYDKYEDVAHYRLDRIADIRVLDTPAKPARKVRGLSLIHICPAIAFETAALHQVQQDACKLL